MTVLDVPRMMRDVISRATRYAFLLEGGAKGGGSRRMSPEDVIGKPAERQCVKIEREWKRRNGKGLEGTLDSDAVERIHTERILGNLRG